MGCHHPNAFRGVWMSAKSSPMIVDYQVNALPIVHAAAFEVAIAQFKAQRLNQVETAVGKGAHSANIAGVLRNLWFEQDNVQRGSGTHGRKWSLIRALEMMFNHLLSLTQFDRFFEIVAFVILLFGAAKADFDLHQAFGKIKSQRDNGFAATLNLDEPVKVFLFVQQ